MVCLSAAVLASGCQTQEQTITSQRQASWTKRDPVAVETAEPEPAPEIHAKTYFAAGMLLENEGQFLSAIRQYNNALAEDPKNLAALNRLGTIYSRLGRHEAAEKAFIRALEIEPGSPQLHNNLGFEFVTQKSWAEACKHFEHAVLLKQDYKRARINLGMTYAKLDRFDDALAEFQRVVPEPDAYYNLGLLLRSAGRYADAAEAFKHALAVSPSFVAARTQLTDLEPKMRQSSEASEGRVGEVAQAEPMSGRDVGVTPPAAAQADVVADEEASVGPPSLLASVKQVSEPILAARTADAEEVLEEEPGPVEPDADEAETAVSSDDATQQLAQWSNAIVAGTRPIALLPGTLPGRTTLENVVQRVAEGLKRPMPEMPRWDQAVVAEKSGEAGNDLFPRDADFRTEPSVAAAESHQSFPDDDYLASLDAGSKPLVDASSQNDPTDVVAFLTLTDGGEPAQDPSSVMPVHAPAVSPAEAAEALRTKAQIVSAVAASADRLIAALPSAGDLYRAAIAMTASPQVAVYAPAAEEPQVAAAASSNAGFFADSAMEIHPMYLSGSVIPAATIHDSAESVIAALHGDTWTVNAATIAELATAVEIIRPDLEAAGYDYPTADLWWSPETIGEPALGRHVADKALTANLAKNMLPIDGANVPAVAFDDFDPYNP